MKRTRMFTAFALVALALAGCQLTPPVAEYTIEQFLDTTAIFGGSFSPDEKTILFSSNQSGIYNAYVMPVEGGEATQLTDSTTDSIFALSYFPNDSRILFQQDRGGNEINHIYVRHEDGTTKELTPGEKARAAFYGWAHDGKSFYYGSNQRNPKFMDIYEMDIDGFKPTLVYRNDAGYGFGGISNDKRYLAFVKAITTNNNEMYLYDRTTKKLTHLSPHEGAASFTPADFSVDSKSLYYTTNENGEFARLKRYDIPSGASEAVEKADWDIVGSFFSHNGKYRVTTINNDARTEIQVDDTATGERVALPTLPDGVMTSVGISRSEKWMRFYLNGSRSPNNLFVLDLETGRHHQLTDTMNPEIAQRDLVEAEVIRYPSFDGLEIPAIFYKPHNASARNKVPALVWVHGGPGGQSRTGYSGLIQYLVNHGYAVLAVNNRGSSGYGKTFTQLDDLKHGEDDLDDCVEAKKFLIGTGFVDENKIGIIGGSYGGYMTLAALTFRPEEFAVGVDMFGISNWVRTLNSIPPWWEAFREALYKEIGNPKTQEEMLRAKSPLFHAEQIVKPLMVLQGANDPRVIQPESDDIVEAVKKNGVPVEYIVFEDEGHGFRKKENQVRGYRAILDFLDKHLKGIGGS